MADKQYAIKIENADLGLMFHFTFTQEEAENTRLHIGDIKLVLPTDINTEEVSIESKSISIKGLFDWVMG